MLYPVTNRKRTTVSLDGIWEFSIVGEDYAPTAPLPSPQPMAVPSSYNELTTDRSLFDHVGKVCYEREFEIPDRFSDENVRLRFGAAAHRADIFVDGTRIASHNGGFLPFEADIPEILNQPGTRRLSVVLDNRLDFETLPVGTVLPENGKLRQEIYHDFANETGIHRHVSLCFLPRFPIEDIVIETEQKDAKALIRYRIVTEGTVREVALLDREGRRLNASKEKAGMLEIENPHLWRSGDGYLYTLEATTDTDQYSERFGIRSVRISQGKLELNGEPVFLKGFGMHEDHPILGKGQNDAFTVRDFNLLKWINANSFRTSHYPYAEEIYRLADELGILIIDEIPAVGLTLWNGDRIFVEGKVDEKTLAVHKEQLSELVQRDKNHPSVIMYSLANEANVSEPDSLPYFEEVFDHMRKQTELPLMIVEWVGPDADRVSQLADVIGVNRYIGWYTDLADLDAIRTKLPADLKRFHAKFDKPILLTEFGADTIAGFHQLPSTIFSEEFQLELIKTYQEILDTLPFVIGEHVWNFADFLTKEGITRFGGNKKGVFTRDRQPKLVAHWLKEAWKDRP